MGGGRWTLNNGGRREIDPTNKWEMGGWTPKQDGDGRLDAKTGGRRYIKSSYDTL